MPADTLNLEDRRFTSADACRAAGIDQATLKNWMSRERAILQHEDDRVAAGKRTFFRFNLRRVMQIVITAELVRAGYAPRHAGVVAAGFTDISSGAYWVGEPHRIRQPGELFETGLTILVAHPDDPVGRLVNVQPGKYWSPFRPEGGAVRYTATVLDLTHVYWEVLRRLGFDRNRRLLAPRTEAG